MKLFRDTIHNYISISKDYCSRFIDTPIFQRLRRIEQTSMRVLYPCAHHDRFAHSLGVYHLGTIAFKNLKVNSEGVFHRIDDETWNIYKNSFMMACLLHDCGHAPFSHTFEKYYDIPARLDDELSALVNDDRFTRDLRSSTSNEHERVSAIIVLKYFKDTIISLGGDPVLAVRMIIGCSYHENRNENDWLANCLIELLNSKAIDLDKLDYTARDSWASGANNSSVDIQRLLSSICIRNRDDRFVLAYNKSSLSVIESVLNARNFLHIWIFSHHKIKYDQYLLEKSVEALLKIIGGGDAERAKTAIFSVRSFFETMQVGDYKFYLVSDDDLIHLLKTHIAAIPESQEYLFREHRYVPLWKTYSEYFKYYGDLREDIIDSNGILRKNASDIIERFLAGKGFSNNSPIILDVTPNIARILPNGIMICVHDEMVCYNQLSISGHDNIKVKPYFLTYVPKEAYCIKSEIIKHLKNSV